MNSALLKRYGSGILKIASQGKKVYKCHVLAGHQQAISDYMRWRCAYTPNAIQIDGI